jgi:hypothetical protein
MGVKLTSHLYLVKRSRTVKLYIHSLICLHDVVLNELSRETILSLHYAVGGLPEFTCLNFLQWTTTFELMPEGGGRDFSAATK